jgi:hypothetical protein
MTRYPAGQLSKRKRRIDPFQEQDVDKLRDEKNKEYPFNFSPKSWNEPFCFHKGAKVHQ